MIKRKNDIIDVIKSLSSNEKRHFRCLSKAFNTNSSDPDYLQLFDCIENGKDELSDLTEHFPKETFAKTKERLHVKILRSQRLYHERHSVDMIIQSHLADAEVLYKMGRADLGVLSLNKAAGLARTHERFGLLLQALRIEKRLNIVLDIPSHAYDEIIIEENLTIERLGQIMALENIYGKILGFKKKYGFVKGRTQAELKKETISSPHLPRLASCKSNEARFYHNFIHSIYYWMTFDHKKAFEYSRTLLDPGRNAILPNDFINALLQHITSSVCLVKMDAALNGILISETYMEENHLDQYASFRSLMYAYQSTYTLVAYNYMGSRSKLKKAIADTESGLSRYDKVLSQELKQIIMGNLMNAYMGIGDLKKADQIWDSIFNRQSKTIRRDIYADLYLFRLFSLLQSRNYPILSSAALSAVRFFRKEKDASQVYEIELPIAMLLCKRIDFEDPEANRKVLADIQKIIVSFIRRIKGADDFQEHYTRYQIWIDSLISGEPYYRRAAAWYKEYKNDPQIG